MTDDVTVDSAPDEASGFSALLFARTPLENWLPAIARVLDIPGLGRVLLNVGGDAVLRDGLLPSDDRITIQGVDRFSDALVAAAHEVDEPLLVMTAPVLLPAVGLEPALSAMTADARIAMVSFLSNAAGYLSFPYRDHPTPYSITGHDETSLTRRLRELDPAMRPAPITVPAGAACLVSPHAVTMVEGPHPNFDGEPEASLMDLALRSQRRGLKTVLDSMTFVARPWELGPWGRPLHDSDQARSMLHQHHHFFPALFDDQRPDPKAPLAIAMSTARAKVEGLRIVIDGSCIGPIENGTQVQTLSLARALAARDDVREVILGLPGEVPRYAHAYLDSPKLRTVHTPDNTFEGVGGADIVHRPFQPGEALPYKRWREVGTRTVITIQDLIAHATGAYHLTPAEWLDYRRSMENSCRRADGVVVISHDVREQMLFEQMPVETDRLSVVQNGTDHLSGDEEAEMPAEFVDRGWVAREFMVVLGANYSHKNRDLAIRMWQELRKRGHGIGLVLAGVSVAQGSSRVSETMALSDGGEEPMVLADVTSEERNWLLRHATICLYPTAAEGFGLVPFEAARFGTPTIHARFGPLAEVMPDVPVTAPTWTPFDLADAAERLINDKGLAREQIEAVLESGALYSWDRTAEGLVKTYRNLLSRARH